MKKEFIINWFSGNSTMSRKEIENNMSINYFEEGLVDSFTFMELITACEENFDIQFSNEDFQNDDIFTIQGLVQILEKK